MRGRVRAADGHRADERDQVRGLGIGQAHVGEGRHDDHATAVGPHAEADDPREVDVGTGLRLRRQVGRVVAAVQPAIDGEHAAAQVARWQSVQPVSCAIAWPRATASGPEAARSATGTAAWSARSRRWFDTHTQAQNAAMATMLPDAIRTRTRRKDGMRAPSTTRAHDAARAAARQDAEPWRVQ
jgi:hypothetical protein